jgi:hypothetical protein
MVLKKPRFRTYALFLFKYPIFLAFSTSIRIFSIALLALVVAFPTTWLVIFKKPYIIADAQVVYTQSIKLTSRTAVGINSQTGHARKMTLLTFLIKIFEVTNITNAMIIFILTVRQTFRAVIGFRPFTHIAK